MVKEAAMEMTMRKAATGIAAAIVLAACSAEPTQQETGMVVGGVLGGILGSQVGHGSGRTTATIIGAVAGAAIGGTIGRTMDDNDRARTAQALEMQRTGEPSSWHNPDTGNRYTVKPTRTYGSDSGPCREYTVDAVVGGRPETVYGTACRQPDGSWRTVG
jgi:surface antigen